MKGQYYVPQFPDPCVLTFEESASNLGFWFSITDFLILQEPEKIHKFLSLNTMYLN